MGNKKGKGFYHGFSRKELQSLCKKHGLPANRSSSDMAKSLASYLENQRLGSMTTWERLYGIQEVGLPLPLQFPFRDAEKDFYGLISCSAGSYNGGDYSQAVKSNALVCCAGDKFYHKDDCGGGSIFFSQTPQPQFVTQYNDIGSKNKEFPTVYFNRNCSSLPKDRKINDMPQIKNKDAYVGARSNEAFFHSSINTPVSSSSFQFHVSSEEGINIYVDLNSNPSNWVEKLKSEVSICQNMSHSKSQSFCNGLGDFGDSRKQLKSYFQLKIDAGRTEDAHIHSGLPPSLTVEEHNALQVDHSNGDEGPSNSTVMATCDEAVDVSENLEGHQVLHSFKALPDVQEEIISSGASSAKDGCLITFDSNINSPRDT